MSKPRQANIHLILMAQALDAYARWLDHYTSAEIVDAEDAQTGTRLVAAVAEIRRAHFPHEALLMTDLLVVHTKLSTLRFERQLKLFKCEPTEPMLKCANHLGLVRKQVTAIAALRAACPTPPPFSEETPRLDEGTSRSCRSPAPASGLSQEQR